MGSFRLISIGALCIISLSILFSGCSNDSGNGPLATPESVQTGYFRDSGVSGLHYYSLSWEGDTDINGAFSYQTGERITFSVGGVILGTAPAKMNITPIDLVPGATDATNPTVMNICRFLISLDQNGNPEDGIEISETTRTVLDDFSFNFTEPLETNHSVSELFTVLNGITPEEGEEQHTFSLCSKEYAIGHFENTLVQIEQEEIEAENVALAVAIAKPPFDAYLIQGQGISIEAAASGGSKQYTFAWELKDNNNEIVFQDAYPPAILPYLSPGNYTLTLTVKDSDGNTGSDQRLITIIDPSLYGILPAIDEKAKVTLIGPETVRTGESINIKADITEGNPPFFYDWRYPEQARYSFSDNPLDATFTFTSPGLYNLSIYVRDSINRDDWTSTLTITVEN